MRLHISFILSAFSVAIAVGPSVAHADEPSPSNIAETGAHPHGGPGMHGGLELVHSALEASIGLSAQQRAAIEASLTTLHMSSREEAVHASHRAALAAQIRAGAIDETALSLPAPTTEERAAHEAAADAAITSLHDTLSADQRSALVAAELAKHAGGPPPGAPEHHEGGPMHLFDGLGLTAAQESAIRAVFEARRPDVATTRARFDAMRAEHEAKLRSFVARAFAAHTFLAPPAGDSHPPGGPDRMVHELASVVSLLTPAQREALAQRIETEGPTSRGPA